MRRLAVALATVALLSGCQTAKDFLGIGTYQKPLPGQRVSVLQLNSSQTADPSLADVKVLLPQPFANPEWPQPGGYASHAMYHLELAGSLHVVWKASIGSGADSNLKILSEPVVGGVASMRWTPNPRSLPSMPFPAPGSGAPMWPATWTATSCLAGALPMTTAGSSSPPPSAT